MQNQFNSNKLDRLTPLFRFVFWVSSVLLITFVLNKLGLTAVADGGTEDIAIQSFDTTGDGILSIKAQRLTLFVLWVLVVGIFTVGILSSSSHPSMDRLIRLGRGPDASNLFLAIQYSKAADKQQHYSGYLRTLGMRKATFVTDEVVQKNSRICFDFETLPGFTGDGEHVIDATVVKARKMPGDSKHFMIEVRLGNMSTQLKSTLANYLMQLSSPRSAYNRV